MSTHKKDAYLELLGDLMDVVLAFLFLLLETLLFSFEELLVAPLCVLQALGRAKGGMRSDQMKSTLT